MVLLLDFGVDEIAVQRELTDERIDLAECHRWSALQITTHKAVFVDVQFERGSAGIFGSRGAEFLCKREHAENATNADLALLVMDRRAECADVSSGAGRARQQLSRREGGLLGIVFRTDAMQAALLSD